MLARAELKRIARSRLEESRVLFTARLYDGAAYLCGYSIELSLKARICTTLKWSGFPETSREFQPYASFRTHNLDVLLSLSGRERHVKGRFLQDWSVFAAWEPEIRYNRIGSVGRIEIQLMIAAAERILQAL